MGLTTYQDRFETVALEDNRYADEVTLRHRSSFAVGVDVGQAHDPTAVAVIERIKTETANPAYAPLWPKARPRFHVRYLERLTLGMSYPAQIAQLEGIMQRPPFDRVKPALVVDYTGVGRPVFDMFAESRVLRIAQGVVITAGREVSEIDKGWSVPKMELVSKLQAALHAGDLKIAKGIADAPVLLRELQDFRVRYTDAGNAVFNAREGAHDDLVLALAMGLFALTRDEPAVRLRVVWGGR